MGVLVTILKKWGVVIGSWKMVGITLLLFLLMGGGVAIIFFSSYYHWGKVGEWGGFGLFLLGEFLLLTFNSWIGHLSAISSGEREFEVNYLESPFFSFLRRVPNSLGVGLGTFITLFIWGGIYYLFRKVSELTPLRWEWIGLGLLIGGEIFFYLFLSKLGRAFKGTGFKEGILEIVSIFWDFKTLWKGLNLTYFFTFLITTIFIFFIVVITKIALNLWLGINQTLALNGYRSLPIFLSGLEGVVLITLLFQLLLTPLITLAGVEACRSTKGERG